MRLLPLALAFVPLLGCGGAQFEVAKHTDGGTSPTIDGGDVDAESPGADGGGVGSDGGDLDGGTDGGPTSFACGNLTCDPSTQYCFRSATYQYSCHTYTNSCANNHSCACVLAHDSAANCPNPVCTPPQGSPVTLTCGL